MSKASFLPQSSEFINFYARVKLEKFLKKVRKMIREQAKLHLKSLDQKQIQTITQPQVFISYAWEGKAEKLTGLQTLLKALKEDFESAGMRPWFDLAQMTGELDEKMRLGIRASQYVLLMGTDRYAARTKPGSDTNVYKELKFTLAEYERRSDDPERADFLLPLMLEGDYLTTFPTLGHLLIRDGRSWYNLEQNDWQSIDNYIERLTEYEPVGILPCLLGLSRLHDYPAYRNACVSKYKDYQKLLMLELNLERGKIEKREFEKQKQELQLKQAELTLSLEKWRAERSSFEKESELVLMKLTFAKSQEESLSAELVNLRLNSSSNKVRLNEVEKELKQERNKSDELRIQYELSQQLLQSKLGLFRKQTEELDSIQAQLASQKKKLNERETAVTTLEKSLQEHQEKLDKQAAEQENMEFVIKEQLTEIKEYTETPGKLKLVTETPGKLKPASESLIQKKSSINPWPETKFDSEWVRKAEGIELKATHMCPVVGRPLYDAVTLKHHTGEDHILSDEAARNWLIVGKNSTCPCCEQTVIGVEILPLLRSIVADEILILTAWARRPQPGTKLKVSPPADTKPKESSPQTMPTVSPNNLNQLLQFVAEGEQEKAEKLIQKDPRLLLLSGDVKDLSGREFKQITAFQYALWAVDWHMWTMIQKYLPKEDQEIQLRELEIRSTAYGKHFTLTGLANALQFYVDNALIHRNGYWRLNWSAETYWSQGVGQEQKLLPAHVVNEYCRLDRTFNPCPMEWKSELPRTRETESTSWFTPLASGVELGSAYAFYRDNAKQVVHRQAPEWPYNKYSINTSEPACATKGVIADLKALQSLWEVRTQQLKLLKSQFLSTPTQSALQNQLVTACKEGDEKQVRMLLENGALPDMPNAKGEQPLGAAVWGMCPNVINALMTRVDGVAPMTWAQCEEHNKTYYKEVFVKTYEPKARWAWHSLLETIESNKFMKTIHLEKACKYYQEKYSWESLKNFAIHNHRYDTSKEDGDVEFGKRRSKEFEKHEKTNKTNDRKAANTKNK